MAHQQSPYRQDHSPGRQSETVSSERTLHDSSVRNSSSLPPHLPIPSFQNDGQSPKYASTGSLGNYDENGKPFSPDSSDPDNTTYIGSAHEKDTSGGSNAPEDNNDYAPPQPSYMAPVQGSPHNSDREYDEESMTDGTATETDDEFDWDLDDDDPTQSNARDNFLREGGGAKAHRAKRGRKLYLAFMGLSRWIRTLLIAAIGAGILITPFVVVVTRYKDKSFRPQVQAWSIWLCISFVLGCATHVLVDFLPHLFTLLVYWIAGKVPENLKTWVELIMALSVWLKLFLSAAWTWIALSIVRAAVKPAYGYWTWVNRVMEAIFSLFLVLLAEKLLLQIIAINFHRKALRDRLDANAEALRALDKLSKAVKPKRVTGHFKSRSRNGTPGQTAPSTPAPGAHVTAHDYIGTSATPTNSHQMKPSPLGTTPVAPTTRAEKRKLKKDQRAQRRANRQSARQRATKVVTGLGRQLKEVAMIGLWGKGPEIGSLASARQLARKLFSNLQHGATDKIGDQEEQVLTVDDFVPYFRSKEDAEAAFSHFDSDGNGDISKKEMRSAVQRIYRERKALTASLADMSSAISKLDGVLLVCALVILIFVFLLIFNKDSITESLLPVSTFVLGFSFIFSNSAKNLFESMIFIFATHPYDCGDLVLVDDSWLFVKEFGMVSTTFRRVDNFEVIIPNSLLATAKLIHNVRRSRAMWEVCSIQVAFDTPLEVLEELNQRVKQYLADNSREWGGGHQVNINNISKQNAITVDIAIEHKSNWQDWGGRWMRRTAFMKHLKTILHSLEMTYTLPLQPIIMPYGAEQAFGMNNFPGSNGGPDMFSSPATNNNTYSASPYLNPQSGGLASRPSLSVRTPARYPSLRR